MNSPTTDQPIERQSFVDGTAVFDVAGEYVGMVSTQDPQAGCLVVEKGWFAHELYVPFSFVVSQDGSGLFLNLSKHELKDERWKVPPPGSDMAAAAANPLVVAGPEMGVVDTSAATVSPLPRSSPVHEPAQPVRPAPMTTAVKNDEQPMSAPPLESVLRKDGRPVDDRVVIEDEQLVAVIVVPDASGAGADWSKQSDAPLSQREAVDQRAVVSAAGDETEGR